MRLLSKVGGAGLLLGLAVTAPAAPLPFQDDFSSDLGWTYGPEWERAPAAASTCPSLGQDPGGDHSPGGDNFLAGVQVEPGGGCIPQSVHGFYYLESPAVDTTVWGVVQFRFWRWLNADYDPYMHSHIQVFNGAVWTTIWTTGSSSTLDSSWSEQVFDLTSFSNMGLRVRFGFDVGSASVYNCSSWNVDDVYVGPSFVPTATSTRTLTPTHTVTMTYTASPTPCVGGYPFFDGFESGGLGCAWFTGGSGTPRVSVTSADGPVSGVYHMILDTAVNGTYSTSEAVLTLNLAGQSNIQLEFDLKDFTDEPHAMPSSFTGTVPGDGVAISQDGINWTTLVSLDPSTVYGHTTLNLSQAMAAAGFSVFSSVRIKFQEYDNYPVASDGFAFDNVRVSSFLPTGTTSPSVTLTSTPTRSWTRTSTVSATPTASASVSPTRSNSPTRSPSASFTPSRTATPTSTLTSGPTPVVAAFPFFDGFESPLFGPAWEVVSTFTGDARIAPTDGPATGNRHLLMDSSTGSTYGLNEVILHINLNGFSNINLGFDVKQFSDEFELLPPSFTGSFNGDGISISEDGITWHRVFSLSPSSIYTHYDFGLDSVMAAAGFIIFTHVRIKFQQYDNNPIPTDGYAYDNVQIDNTPRTATITRTITNTRTVTLSPTETPTPGPSTRYYFRSDPSDDPPSAVQLLPIPPGGSSNTSGGAVCFGSYSLGTWATEPFLGTVIPAGTWNFRLYGYDANFTLGAYFHVMVYEYSGTVPGTYLFDTYSPVLANSLALHEWVYVQPTPISITPGNRIYVEVLGEYGFCSYYYYGTAFPVLHWDGAADDSSVDIPDAAQLSVTPTYTWSPRVSGTSTDTPTPTASQTATNTETPTESPTPSPLESLTGTFSPTASFTHTSSFTSTSSPTDTLTPTLSWTPTPSWTWTPTGSSTSTPSWSPTSSPTSTETSTDSPTATLTRSPTATPTWSSTETDTPSDTMSATPTGTATATWTATPTPSRTPTHTPSWSPTPSASPTDSSTATGSATATPSPSDTPSPSPTWTPSHSQTDSPTPTASWSPTHTSTRSPTPTWTPTLSGSPTPTATPSWSSTASHTWTPTDSPTASPSGTRTGTATGTSSETGTGTQTRTGTPTESPSATQTASPTNTSTSTPTDSATETGTLTRTSTGTPSFTPSGTWSRTNTATDTPTPSNTSTLSSTATRTVTRTDSATYSPTWTPSDSPTATPSLTWTPTLSRSPTPTASTTESSTQTASRTSSWTGTPSPTGSFTPTGTSSRTASWTPTWSATPTASPTLSGTPTPTPSKTHSGTLTESPTASVTRTSTRSLTISSTLTITPTPALPIQLSKNVFAPGRETLLIEGLVQDSGALRVAIYNIVGERIRNLAELRAVGGQPFGATWDGRNDKGEFVGNGVYVILLRGPAGVLFRKVIVLK